MRETSKLRIVRGRRGGYLLVTTGEASAIVGEVIHARTIRGSGWRYWPRGSGSSMSRKLWPTPEAALEARRLAPAGWVRAAFAAAEAGE